MHENPLQPESNDSQREFPVLSRGLKSVYIPHPQKPAAETDAAIRAAIHTHFANPSRASRTRWRTLPWAVAAVILISVTAWLTWPGTHIRQNAPLIAQQPGDIDRNGRIDILDAFAIARYVDGSGRLDGSADVNADGAIDQADVDLIATRAVQLNPASNQKEASS